MDNQENYNININDQDNRVLIINSKKINNLETNNSPLINKRIDYFDYLRIFCSFSIVILHVALQNWITSPIKSHEWKIFNFYNGVVRYGVPIFFMISGTLFLQKNITFSIMIKKYIKHICINLIFWSFFYALKAKIIYKYSYKYTFIIFLYGHYHFWFLFLICALYLITPILKEITKNEIIFKIFLILNFIFGFLFHNLLYFLSYYSKDYYKAINQILAKLELNGFLEKTLFIFFKYKFNDLKYRKRIKEFIQKLGRLTFGIYIIHPFVIEELNRRFKFNTLSFEPLYSVPIISLITFLISLLIVYLVKLIPFINQYIF